MSGTRNIELSRVPFPSDASLNPSVESAVPYVSHSHNNIDETPPSRRASAFTDARPSRRYQIALVVGGFFMIFQVMGLNSIYGVFQVRSRSQITVDPSFFSCSCRLIEKLLGVLYVFIDHYSGCRGPGRFGQSGRDPRLWLYLGRGYIRQPLDCQI